MEQIGERTRDFIQANAGVELTRKLGTDAKMTPQELAIIVKQLPVSAWAGCGWLFYVCIPVRPKTSEMHRRMAMACTHYIDDNDYHRSTAR